MILGVARSSAQCCYPESPGNIMPHVARIGEGNGTPLQYSCLENPMGGGAWKAAVHGVAEGRTRLSDFTFTFHFNALEKEMATHSSVLAWRIPGTAEPGVLPSMGSHRVGHDWSDLAAVAVARMGKDQIKKFQVWFLLNVYHFLTTGESKNQNQYHKLVTVL